MSKGHQEMLPNESDTVAEDDDSSFAANPDRLLELINAIKGKDSLGAFAIRTEISKGNLSRILKGEADRPRESTLDKIYAAYLNSELASGQVSEEDLPIQLNDLRRAAGYRDKPKKIPSFNFGVDSYTQIVRPRKNSLVHVSIDYLENNNISEYTIEHIENKSYLVVRQQDNTELYFFSLMSDEPMGADKVIRRMTPEMKALRSELKTLRSEQSETESRTRILLVTNDRVVFSLCNDLAVFFGGLEYETVTIFTSDTLTMTDININVP